MQNRIVSLVCSVLVLCCAGAANACGNGKLLFEEKFAQRPAYIAEDAAIKYDGGVMIETRTQYLAWVQWPLTTYRDYEVCAKVNANSDKLEKGAPLAGLAFFVFNEAHYARILVSNVEGSFRIDMRSGQNWLVLISPSVHQSINKGATAENEISVSTRGNFALVRINGKVVAELNIPMGSMDGKTLSGLARQSAPEGQSVLRIKDFQIRESVWDKK